jgi:hypothetical protein
MRLVALLPKTIDLIEEDPCLLIVEQCPTGIDVLTD